MISGLKLYAIMLSEAFKVTKGGITINFNLGLVEKTCFQGRF